MNPPYSSQTPPHSVTTSSFNAAFPALSLGARYRLFGLGVLLPLFILITVMIPLWLEHGVVFDRRWILLLHHYVSPVRNDLAITLAYLGGLPVSAGVGLLLVAGVSAIKHGQARRQWLVFLLTTLVGAVVVSWSMKLLCHRPRPELWPRLVQEYGASFPNGHSLYAMVLAYVGILLSWCTRWRRLVICLGGLWVVLMGLSRVYLGVHYPTDVIGGWLLGMIWVSLMYLGWAIRFDPQHRR